MSDLSRRDFVASTSTLAFGAMIVPRHVLGGVGHRAPSDTLNVAIVGAGGMGMSNMTQLLGENIVAICDVDFAYVERSLADRLRPNKDGVVSAEATKLRDAYMKAAKYADFREMLDKQKDIQAVVIATPDHMHATIAMAAMRAGKHVYVQKPLTYSVYEARLLAKTAKETGLVTQMGNQGHSMDGTRRINEIIASGVIGRVHDVHVWTDRPVRYWAQGIPRPGSPIPAPGAQQPVAGMPTQPAPPRWNMRTVDNAVLKAMADNPQSPPNGLHWDLFLGAVPDVPYHPAYHPFSWRGWIDFGVSSIGDMGAHLIDQPYWALGLTQPTAVSASSSPWGGSQTNPASYPLAMTAEYEFPAVGKRGPVRLFWYDGGLMPPRPAFLPDDITLPRGDGGGGVFIGEKGILTYETYGKNPKVYPEAIAAKAEKVPVTIPRIDVPHEVNWAQACKGVGKASSPFEYAAALTETMLLPIVALRGGQGRKMLYDAANMRVTNIPEINKYLTREYRAGWSL
jgi:predicted dehydrogenase